MKNAALLLFALLVAGELVAQLTELEWLHHLCKPLIMVFLGLYYALSTSRQQRSWLVLLAVLFSFLGDSLLMYESRNEMYFLLGLGAFLAAQLFYLFTYREHSDYRESNASQISRLRLAFPVVLAGTGLFVILYPTLRELQIPVFLYAMVITAMVITAIYRLGRTSFNSFVLVLFGALLFMLSDSLLAINKFLEPIPSAGFWIMLTYISAQFLIITGLLRHFPARD